MSPLQSVVLFAAGALAVRLLGGFVCRVAGWSFLIAGAAAVGSEPSVKAFGFLATGCLLWVVGDWHHALRRGSKRGPLGGRVIGRR